MFDFKIFLDGIREFLTGKTDCLSCGKWFKIPGARTSSDDYYYCSTECKIKDEKNVRK